MSTMELETSQPKLPRNFLGGRIIAPPHLDRDEWLKVRRQGIGGSDAAVIAGLSKFKTPYALWLDKRGLVPHDDEPSEAAYWGNVLEGVVSDEFQKRTGHRVWGCPGTMQHKDLPWMLVNPDRLVVEQGKGEISALLECKTTGFWARREWADGELPYAAALQVQHAFAVTGLQKAYVPALIGGQQFVIVEVESDDDLIAMLIKMEGEFWERVILNDPPSMDGEPSTSKLVNQLYEADPGKVVELDKTVIELIQDRELHRLTAAQIKTRQDECDNKLKTLLGDAEVGTVDGEEVVTWKTGTRKGYTVDETTTRTLRVKSVIK